MSLFSRKLVSWFKKNARDLPWRRTTDPYKIWISEVMLQQTTVATVIPKFKKWIEQFPSVEKVAQASEQEILKAWQGLGYYSRARNIKKTAEIICKEFNGKLPDDPAILAKFPGFGPYTTGAVASLAFHRPEPIVDANIRRVVMRLKAIQGSLKAVDNNVIIDFLRNHLSARNANPFNQGFMELGALICRPKNPLCASCPVNDFCAAYKNGIQELIPPTEKKTLKDISVALAVVQKDDKYFIQRRQEKGLLNGLWEFPGGKIEGKETPQEALLREVKEELDSEVTNVRFLMETKHFYTQFRVNIHAFLCSPKTPISTSLDRKWMTLQKIREDYPMPSGSAKILAKLQTL